MLDQAADRLRLEEVGRVLDDTVEAAVEPFLRAEREIEARPRPLGQRHRLERHAAEHQRLRRDVVREEHLEDGRVARVALRVQRLHEPLERQLLVCERVERRRAHPLEQLHERQLVLHRDPERERVGEVPDQRLCLVVVSAGDRSADDDVLHVGVAVKERVEGREQDGEERGVVRARERAERIDELGRQREPRLRSSVRLRGRPRPVGGEVEAVGCACELSSPVVDELAEQRAVEALALPRREIAVLDRKLGQRGLAAFESCRIPFRELAQQDPARRVIRGEMVAREDEQVVIVELEEGGADHHVLREVERLPGEARRPARRRRPGCFRRSWTSSTIRASERTCCAGTPSVSTIAVRSTSWRDVTRSSAR